MTNTYIKIKTLMTYEMEYFINVSDISETNVENVEYFQGIINKGKYQETRQEFVDEVICEVSFASEEEAIKSVLLDNPYLSGFSTQEILNIVNRKTSIQSK